MQPPAAEAAGVTGRVQVWGLRQQRSGGVLVAAAAVAVEVEAEGAAGVGEFVAGSRWYKGVEAGSRWCKEAVLCHGTRTSAGIGDGWSLLYNSWYG